MNFKVFVDQASIRDRRLIADFSFISRPLLEVGVNSEGACNRVNTVGSLTQVHRGSQRGGSVEEIESQCLQSSYSPKSMPYLFLLIEGGVFLLHCMMLKPISTFPFPHFHFPFPHFHFPFPFPISSFPIPLFRPTRHIVHTSGHMSTPWGTWVHTGHMSTPWGT